MSYSVEVPNNSDSHYDYECKSCSRRIRFTTAFFTAGFEFPLTSTCAKCGKPFTVDVKRKELDLVKQNKK